MPKIGEINRKSDYMAKVVIDIGHAARTGATGCGYEEHSLMVPLAMHLEVLLRDAGHEVVVLDFPKESNGEDLQKTVDAANAEAPDFGISLHCDWADNEFARGAHACYRSQGGKRLAQAVMKHLGKWMLGRADKINLRRNLKVLNQTKAVWVLVECGFITNPQDAVKMHNNPQVIALHIARGVIDYINQKKTS